MIGIGELISKGRGLFATTAQGAKADAALPANADAIADVLEAAATGAPADLARIQASVSGYLARKNRPLRVSAIGDSIVQNHYGVIDSQGNAGIHRSIQLGGAWLHSACGLLDGVCIPDVYAMEGNSGLKTFEILANLKPANSTIPYGVGQTIPCGLAARLPDIAIDMSGTNDVTYYDTLGDLDGPAKSTAFRRQIWEYIRSLGIQPIAMSLLPRDDGRAAKSPIYNAAYKAAADADGVPWIDVYTPCAVAGTGLWKANYTYRVGAADASGLHPWWLGTTKGMAPAVAKVLRNICAPNKVPRLTMPAGYLPPATAWKPDGRFYYAQICNGLLPNASEWTVRIDGDANATIGLAASTIDTSGGGTIEFSKATGTGSSYSDAITTTSVAVEANQEYTVVCDLQFDSTTAKNAALTVQAVSNENRSIGECYVEHTNFIAPFTSDVYRAFLYFVVPTGTTSVKLMMAINRVAGGIAGGFDRVRVANISMFKAIR